MSSRFSTLPQTTGLFCGWPFRPPSLPRLAKKRRACALLFVVMLGFAFPARAVVLWSELEPVTVNNNGAGTDLLAGAVKRDDSANDTLYFKFHVDPLSDETTEPYFAALELFEGDREHLGVGNALAAWGYSAFLNSEGMTESNRSGGYVDLHSARPNPAAGESLVNFQLPQRGVGVTIVFKIQFVPGGDDLVTVWLNPDLGPGANEVNQPETLTTRFNANGSFDELRLRHGGSGGGWTFSDIAIATTFNDFVDVSSTRPAGDKTDFARGAPSLHYRAWTREQGLPASVRALTQTREGYLWLAGDSGLTRFDGLRFVSLLPGKNSATNFPARVLFGDSRGALWIGTTNDGLKRRQNGEVLELNKQNGLPSDAITALAEDDQGKIWIGTDAGLVLWQNGKLAALENAAAIKDRAITALFKDRQGDVWLGAKGAGVFHRSGEKFLPAPEFSDAGLLADSHCLLADKTGRLWIGAGVDSVLCLADGRWQRYHIPQRQSPSFVCALAEEPDGTIWAASDGGGLFQFVRDNFTAVATSSGFAGKSVGALLVDREGKLWAGSDEALNRLQRKTLFALGQNEGLGFGVVRGLAEVSPGVVWAIKPNDGIYRWDGQGFSRLKAAGLSPRDTQVNAVFVARDGVCWVAGENGLLRYKDPVAAADEVKPYEMPGENVLALAEDRDGVLWAGTQAGKIWCLNAGVWTERKIFSGTNAVTAILPEPGVALWIGTDGGGLFRLAGQKLERFGSREGLASDAIRALHLDGQGTLWIGTAGGLSRWRGGRIFNFNLRDGPLQDAVSQILEDDFARLWLGTGRGLACVRKSRLEEFAAGKTTAVFPKYFTRADGMLSEECTGGFFPAGLKTQSGLLWFSTTKGVAVVAPPALPSEMPMPGVTLEEILLDGVPVGENFAPATLQIPPGKHRLELRYAGLRFDSPEQIRFRYRLQGWDAGWIDAGTDRSAIYNFVPPGEYQFTVTACDSDGKWAASGAELKLIFARFFWQSWWFIGIASVILLSAVGGAVRLVERQKVKTRLKRLEQERALEQERTRIARDLHDEMGAKLCRISFLSEHARREGVEPAEIREQIKSISDDSREVLHSLDEIVWAVNPQNDTLEHAASYLAQYAQEYFQMTGVECELVVPAQLPPHPVSSQVRHHLFLAVREALANVLKHSGATHAKISMGCIDAGFEILIKDDGKGFDAPAKMSDASHEGDTHDGLRNMTKRFADVGGECFIESATGRGTMVKFLLPLPVAEKAK